MKLSYTVEEVRKVIGEGELEGDFSGSLTGIASLVDAVSGDLSFLGNMKYKGQLADTKASLVLVPLDCEAKPKAGQAYIRLDNPSMALAKVCRKIEQSLWPKLAGGVHKTAVIEEGAEVDSTASVGAFCFVGKGAKVGSGVVLEANVHIGNFVEVGDGSWLMAGSRVMDYCKLAEGVNLQPGAIIGSHGFGYETVNGVHEKVPQIGIVALEKNVEIGANTTIDRARFGVTRIGEGTKVDNLVQIAHNVEIGKGCFIVAQAGIAGSTVIEDYCMVGGQVGIAGHLRVGKGTKIGAQSGLNHDLEAGSFVRGSPVHPYMMAHKLDILKKRLPDLFKRVKNLEEVIETLKVES